MAELIPVYQTLYGAKPPTEIQQVKYAPAPVPVSGPMYQTLYGAPPVGEIQQVKYAPAPVQPTVVVTMPPVTQEEAETVVSSISTNNESVLSARSFKDEIETISQNADTVINNTSYVTGEFGKALTYASQVVKEDIDALNKYSQNNLLVAMNKVGEYEDNIAAMRAILRPIIGEYSTDRFDESGHLIVSDAIRSNYSKEIAITEELFRNNKTLKDEISSLSNSSISKS